MTTAGSHDLPAGSGTSTVAGGVSAGDVHGFGCGPMRRRSARSSRARRQRETCEKPYTAEPAGSTNAGSAKIATLPCELSVSDRPESPSNTKVDRPPTVASAVSTAGGARLEQEMSD